MYNTEEIVTTTHEESGGERRRRIQTAILREMFPSGGALGQYVTTSAGRAVQIESTVTSQASASDVAIAVSLGRAVHIAPANFWVGSSFLSPQPRGQASVGWRAQLANLETWRGDIMVGEAPSIASDAIKTANSIGTIAETIAKIEGVVIDLDLFPVPEGGVQLEWTARRDSVEHLEIVVLPQRPDRFEVLWTTESLDGHISRVNVELADATLAEAIAALSSYHRWLALHS